ncbi:MAG: hypothetical protein MI865_10215 [Proteobacteria bacterium]|nr:hypothetical protein [Pseudomonadota bacterium]
MTKLIDTPLLAPLADFALLSITGNDRHEFLHAQFINDLNLIEKPAAQLSGWCNPKGQVISNFLIINTGTSYLLLFKDELKELIYKRLSMFVLRADVQINDISDQSPIYGLANIKDLSIIGPDISNYPGNVQAFAGLIICCLPDNSDRYLIMGSKEIIESKVSELTPSIQLSDNATWELLDILAGLPWITSTTQEQYLPQMLNLDALHGLSYQKGCYPGQEVIARLHYKGKVKKRLQLIKLEQAVSIGNDISIDDPDNHVGNIVNTAKHSDGTIYALAVIEIDSIDKKLIIENQPDNKITVLDLPYAIEV